MDYVFKLVHKYSQIVKKHQLSTYYNHNILGTKITCFHSQGIKITAVIYKQVYYVSSHSVSEAIGSLLKTFKGFNESNWIMHTLGHMHNSLGQTKNKNKSDSISLCPVWLTSPIVTFSTSKTYQKKEHWNVNFWGNVKGLNFIWKHCVTDDFEHLQAR